MGIQDIQNHPPQTAGRIEAKAPLQQAENPEAPASRQDKILLPRYDEYIPEEEADRQAIGLYHIEPDEDGKPRVVFDAPNGEPEPQMERCTADTGNVDREIEKLKEEKKQLEQQLRLADDPQKAAKLQQQLAALEGELAQKDNDAYRRQHTVFS